MFILLETKHSTSLMVHCKPWSAVWVFPSFIWGPSVFGVETGCLGSVSEVCATAAVAAVVCATVVGHYMLQKTL